MSRWDWTRIDILSIVIMRFLFIVVVIFLMGIVRVTLIDTSISLALTRVLIVLLQISTFKVRDKEDRLLSDSFHLDILLLEPIVVSIKY